MEQSTAAHEARIGQLTRELGEARAELRTRTEERDEARRQQTATADVLKVMSRSGFDLQAVFETLVDLAARLCRAERATILRLNGDCFTLAASYGMPVDFGDYWQANPFRIDRGSLSGRAVLDGLPVHVPDVLADPEFTQHELQKLGGFRSALAAPLMRDGSPIGSIFLTRAAVDPFTHEEIGLITTFADQAVIAIENTRLLDEVQARTRELQESLEYQTATSEVLSVISRAPLNSQKVFETIVETAACLCRADGAVIFKGLGQEYEFVASNNVPREFASYFAEGFRRPAHRGSATGRAMIERQAVHIVDVLANSEFTRLDTQRLGRFRTALAVPLLRGEMILGVLFLYRTAVHPFSDNQVELVKTFADQAVMAIENTRLFDNLQARTRELQEALDQQTATSEVLQVISRSKFHLQPVLDAIVEFSEPSMRGRRSEHLAA